MTSCLCTPTQCIPSSFGNRVSNVKYTDIHLIRSVRCVHPHWGCSCNLEHAPDTVRKIHLKKKKRKFESVFVIASVDKLRFCSSILLLTFPFVFSAIPFSWRNVHVHVVGFVGRTVGRWFFQIFSADFLFGIIVAGRFSFGASVGCLVSGRFIPTVRGWWWCMRRSTLWMATRFTFRTRTGPSGTLLLFAWRFAAAAVRWTGLFAITWTSTAPSSGLLNKGNNNSDNFFWEE